MIETDCAAVCLAFNAGHQDLSRLCVTEIDRLRRNNFYFSISLVKRDCNIVARELAKLARVDGSDTVGFWSRTVPNQIRLSIYNDCNQLERK